MQVFKVEGARATLFPDGPKWNGASAMTVGRFSCNGPESGAEVLGQIEARARSDGASGLIGPMDGDTWHSYRLVTQAGTRPPFLMEPRSNASDNEAFARAGFVPISSYFSAIVDLHVLDQRMPEPPADLTVECWDGRDEEALFAQVHALSSDAFSRNPFFKPIGFDAFLDMYRPVVPLLRPELILFARAPDGALRGFLFGVPNYAEGPQPGAVILKTYASLQKGAGHALSARFYQEAKRLGYRSAIHALIHDDNLSALRSAGNGAKVFRRYALMGRRLG
ncbi:MAG: hypothetical protein AAGB10_00875 [Pseudomonadota bacterium]